MHKKLDVIRAWHDVDYRNSLSEEELASLPENPAGLATVDETALRSVTGSTKLTANCDTRVVDSCHTPSNPVCT
jgi:mersacidin/lichenicidin family type 2 lantibiotic